MPFSRNNDIRALLDVLDRKNADLVTYDKLHIEVVVWSQPGHSGSGKHVTFDQGSFGAAYDIDRMLKDVEQPESKRVELQDASVEAPVG